MNPTWTDKMTAISTAVAAGGAIVAGIFIPITTFARRPGLSLHEDAEASFTRVEGNGFPYLRLVVRNKGWRRVARRTRVLVARHHERGVASSVITMGSPALGWTSVFDEKGLQDDSVDIFAGGERPIDFGVLVPAIRDSDGRLLVDGLQGEDPARLLSSGGKWQLRLALAHGLGVRDQREWLAPTTDGNGYLVRLEVGADDGKARKYDVYVDWEGQASDAETALRSVTLKPRKGPSNGADLHV